jgi:hypothetical protein
MGETYDLVEVRAVGVYSRGLQHIVKRRPGEALGYLQALCGLTPRRGWVALPSYSSGRCQGCDRKAERLAP